MMIIFFTKFGYVVANFSVSIEFIDLFIVYCILFILSFFSSIMYIIVLFFIVIGVGKLILYVL